MFKKLNFKAKIKLSALVEDKPWKNAIIPLKNKVKSAIAILSSKMISFYESSYETHVDNNKKCKLHWVIL